MPGVAPIYGVRKRKKRESVVASEAVGRVRTSCFEVYVWECSPSARMQKGYADKEEPSKPPSGTKAGKPLCTAPDF